MASLAWGGRTPRRWQAEALPAVLDAVRRKRAAVVSAVMGAGKSVLVAELARRASEVRPDEAVVVAAPTQALVRQLSATVASVCGPDRVGQFFADAKQPDRPVVVACNASLAGLVEALEGRRVVLLVSDECHGSEAAQVREVAPALAPRAMVGFTATPFRSVATEALSLWDEIAYRYTLADALRERVLVPWRTVNWSGQGSDDVDAVVLDMIRQHGEGPGIVSAQSIPDAKAYAATLTAAGVRAEAIHSQMGAGRRDALLAALEVGDLRCLVHVALLAEGVDLPWLRWLALRRPVAARVRLVQEFGRVLRCHPGKHGAVVMDPHDLLGRHGIQHPEALGQALEQDAVGEPERTPAEQRVAELKALPPARVVEEATTWARGLLLALQAAGAVPASAVPAGAWRTAEPTAVQLRRLASLGRFFARHLPPGLDDAVLRMSREHVAARMQRGAVSDLLSVLATVASAAPEGGWEARRGWRYPWPEGLGVEAPDVAAVIPARPTKRWMLAHQEEE